MAKRSVCETCGMSLEGEAAFCPECGNRMICEIPEASAAAPQPFSSNIPPVPPAGNMHVSGGYIPPVNNVPVNNGYIPPVNSMPGTYGMPYQYQPQPKPQGGARKVMAIIGMVVGIVSIVLCCLNIIDIFIAVAGLIFSIIGVKSTKKGCAIAGIICSGVGLLSAVTILIIGLVGISIAEDAGVDLDSYYTEDYDSFGDMYDDMYDDVYEGIYGDVYDDIEGYYE